MKSGRRWRRGERLNAPTQKKDDGSKKIKEIFSNLGIKGYYVLDIEGRNICSGDFSSSKTAVISAMFATIFAASETIAYEMGVEKEINIKIEMGEGKSLLLFKADEQLIVVVELEKDSPKMRKEIERLKNMLKKVCSNSF
ncbi:MAG TPA: hypothetical protein EYP29_05685 [Thermoplasmata archaeon]|nr:hypothetical protein [Thermoplasmata archaeon]